MLISIIVFIVLVAGAYIAIRNRLIDKKNQVTNTEASIDVMLKKRVNLFKISDTECINIDADVSLSSRT